MSEKSCPRCQNGKINGGQSSDNFLKDVVQTLVNPKPTIIPKVSILEVGQSDSFLLLTSRAKNFTPRVMDQLRSC